MIIKFYLTISLFISTIFVFQSFSQSFWFQLNPFPISSDKTNFVTLNNGNLLAGHLHFWLSTDKGITWTWMYRAPYGYAANNLFIDKFNGNLFLSYETINYPFYTGLYKSDNNGYNWFFIGPELTGEEYVNDLVIKRVGDLQYLFLGTGDYEYPWTAGIYMSTNGGINWSKIRTTYSQVALALDSLGNLYYGTENRSCRALLAKSTDDGMTWNAVFVGNECSLVTDIGISKDSTIVIIVGEALLYLSRDLGNNWKKISNDGLIKFDVVVTNDYIFVATDYGVIFSKDKGSTWNYLNSGLNDTHTYKIHLDNIGYLYVVSGITNAKVYKSNFPIIKPRPVNLILPLDNSEIFYNVPELIWSDSIKNLSYHIQLGLDSSFNSILIDTLIVSDTVFIVPAGLLNYEKSYYWRVRSTNFIDTSDWSKVYKFIIKTPKPSLIFPECGTTLTNNIVPFIWKDVLNLASLFRFQLSRDSQFYNILIDTLINDTLINLNLSRFDNNLRYYWRVKALYGLNNESEWSNICYFTVLILNVVNDKKQCNVNFLLIYPNPTNYLINIKFKIDKYNFVDLRFFDLLGREVEKLYNTYLLPGEYRYEYKVDKLSSGIYFVNLQIGNDILHKKIIISK